MPPRLYVDSPLSPGAEIALPPNASRHVQVLRLQPGDALTLFDGAGGQWQAEVRVMGRREVTARAIAHEAVELELVQPVTLAPGMPANERMDTLIEKATELGATAIAPLMTERSVLRVAGERAERKAQHWQAVAVSACEQSGRNRVPPIAAPQTLASWLPGALAATDGAAGAAPRRGLQLSLDPAAPPLARVVAAAPAGTHWVLLSGPEGGLSPAEQDSAARAGFTPVSLGPRVLRADTAPLAALAIIAALAPTA